VTPHSASPFCITLACAYDENTPAISQSSLGGRAIGTWLTQGRYDVVLVADFPDEASASAFALGTGMAGRLTTETMRAYTPEETDAILAKLTT
jgi:uncharacterized protein with GYD domain